MPEFERLPRAFISYAQEDAAIANAVARDLRANYIDVWIDREGLIPGSPDWEATLREAVATSSCVVLIATPNSRASRSVQSELLLAEADGLPVYPVWAAGEKWIESAPLSFSRTQYQDIRGGAYTGGIARLAELFTAQGHALPPHFLYRSFHQILPPDVCPPTGSQRCGSVNGYLVYQKTVPEQYMVVEHMPWFGSDDLMSQKAFDAILIRPSAYRTAAHLLDALYLNYLSERFAPFTYGISWVLCTGAFGDGVLAIDPHWVRDGKVVVPEDNVSRRMVEPPGRYNLDAGEEFSVSEYIDEPLKIVCANHPWVTKRLIRHPKGKYAVVKEVLELKPADQIDLSQYPYVAVVDSSYLPGEYDPHLGLIQVRECTPEIMARFDD